MVIEPAFNSFASLPAGELRTDLLALAEENGMPVQDVLVSDASRRTTALNAYVSGFGSTRRIVLYDTVLERLPDDEIESIVAHELGHVANRRRPHRHADRRARAGAGGRGAGGWLLSSDAAAAPGRRGVARAIPGSCRWCCSSSPSAPWSPRRCRTWCPGRSRRGPTSMRST